MFTFSFSSAFAVNAGYSWTETEAGLASAQAEAIASIEATDVSKYTANGKLYVQALQNTAIYEIKLATTVNDKASADDATLTSGDSTYLLWKDGTQVTDKTATYSNGAYKKNVPGVTGIYLGYKFAVANMPASYTAINLEVEKAVALNQWDDYAVLLNGLVSLSNIEAKYWTAVGYESYATLDNYANYAINEAKTIEELNAVVDKYIDILNQVILAQKTVTDTVISSTTISNLVAEIRQEASKQTVKISTHGAALVNEYEALLEEAVAAAKAVTTWPEYYAVEQKYVGYPTTTVAVNETYGIVIKYAQKSAFEKLANKDLAVAKRQAFVSDVLASVGEMNLDLVTYTDATASGNWAKVEAFYTEANYFVENGTWKTDSPSDLALILKTQANNVQAGTLTSAYNGYKKTVVDGYKQYLALEAYKTTVIGTDASDMNKSVTTYYGLGMKGESNVNSTGVFDTIANAQTAYGIDKANLIASYKTTAIANIKAATSKEAVDAIYKQLKADVDAVKTIYEVTFEKSLDTFNTALEDYVNECYRTAAVGIFTEADKLAVTRLVADIEAAYKKAQTTYAATPANIVDYVLGKLADKTFETDYNYNNAGQDWLADYNTAVAELGALGAYYNTPVADEANWSTGTTKTYKVTYTGNVKLSNLITSAGLVAINPGLVEALGYKTLKTPLSNHSAFATSALETYSPLFTTAQWANYNEMYANYNTYTARVSAWNNAAGQTWYSLFGLFDAYNDQLATLKTDDVLKYNNLCEEATKLIAKVPTTPSTLGSYETLYNAANTAVNNAVAAYKALKTNEQALVTLFDTSAWDAVTLAYEHVLYEDSKSTTVTGGDYVTAFGVVAPYFMSGGAAYDVLSTANKTVSAKAVAAGYTAIAAATTKADKEAAAKAALADLEALLYDYTNVNSDYSENLAVSKAYAATYFARYESQVFTSSATTKVTLAKEIASFGAFDMADVYVTTKKIAGKGIQVTCDVVPGATAYKFYRATSKNGTYKFMLEKTTNTYTNTKVTKGVKYFYKVTAVVNGAETEMTTHTGIRTW